MKLIKQKHLSIIKLRALLIENSTQHTITLILSQYLITFKDQIEVI